MPAKRHHAVPQFYQRRFADSDGYLWLHDLERRTATKVHTKDALVEKHLYAPEVGPDPYDDSIEQFFSLHVEAPAAASIGNLAKGEAPSQEQRMHIATFLALQEIRVPRMRDTISKFVSEIGQRILDLYAEHPDSMKASMKEAGIEISDAAFEVMISGINHGGIKVQATKTAWLHSFITSAGEIAEMLFRMPWFVAMAHPGVEFLTSDAPVVKVLTDHSVPNYFAGGWLSPSAEATFALDPTTCLVVKPDGKEGHGLAPKLWCKNVNSRLIRQANRFVVSHSRDGYVERIAERRKRASGIAGF